MRITVSGAGFVGLSNAFLLAEHNNVTITDIDESKIQKLNQGICPIHDPEIETIMASGSVQLTATTDIETAYTQADIVIIAVPTAFNPSTSSFDTTKIESVIDTSLKSNPEGIIVIRSTVPVGYTRTLKEKFKSTKILFAPEFLREGKGLYDCLHPTRIVIGGEEDDARQYGNLMLRSIIDKDVPLLYTTFDEAEAIKLFSNTYLALRVAFFNELDSFAEAKGIDSGKVIKWVCTDPRIGDYYNNPSFGYGGYCLPKDTSQLVSDFAVVPQKMISAIVESNQTRKNLIALNILRRNPEVVGIYRLNMKSESDNLRNSAILDVITELQSSGVEIVIFEPKINAAEFHDLKIIKDLSSFKIISDVIVANRINAELDDSAHKVYSRDIYRRD